MKSLSRKNSILFTLIFLLCATAATAQHTFKYQSALPKADSTGFYRIALPPAITAKSNADLSDIRIISSKNKFNPYIFGSSLPYRDQDNFVDFRQIRNGGSADTATVFIAENTTGLTINQLWLRLRNTLVQRQVNISGSDDLNNWYAIRENLPLEQSAESKSGVYQQLLNFPSSNYRYFKIQISNKSREAVAILQAGVYLKQSVQPGYEPLRIKSFKQRDSTTASYITIHFEDAYPVNKLYLAFNDPGYYKRDVLIYTINGNQRVLLDETSISSADSKNGIDLSAKSRTLELEIINGDNPPLAMKSVRAVQLSQSLLSYIQKGESYTLLFGDEKATAPVYDLQFFADSLQRPLPLLTPAGVKISDLHKSTTQAPDAGVPNWVIWVAIAVALLILGLLTFKMTQEVNRRASN